MWRDKNLEDVMDDKLEKIKQALLYSERNLGRMDPDALKQGAAWEVPHDAIRLVDEVAEGFHALGIEMEIMGGEMQRLAELLEETERNLQHSVDYCRKLKTERDVALLNLENERC